MQEETPDFQAIVEALNESGIRYVLVGGLAMTARGSAHVTQDIDISYARDPDNLARMEIFFNAHHARLRGVPEDLPFILDVKTFKNTFNLTLTADFGSIDLLGAPAGVENFEGLWERADELELYGLPVRVASVEDLMAMKRAANRPKDQQHLLELEDLLALIRAESNESPA